MLRSTAKKLFLLWKSDEFEGVTCLPEDLVIEILTRLPVKSLLRFKCVCKHWYTLIRSPDFISLHYHHDSNPTDLVFQYCLGFYDSETPNHVFSVYRGESLVRHQNFDDPHMTKTMDVAGPVNGLFLFIDVDLKLELWNPAIRESRIIPDLNPNFPEHIIHRNAAWGFGLDPVTHEYKVILVQYFLDSTLHGDEDVMSNPAVCILFIGVYNLATDSWNLLDPDSAKFPRNLLFQHASVYLNGHHYWISFSCSSIRITAFDTRNEMCRELHAPTQFTFGRLSLYNDDIALLSRVENTNTIDVWVMEVEGCWTKKLTIENLSELHLPLKLWKNNEFYYEDMSTDLVLYNISTRESKTTGITGFQYGINVFEYKESLVSVGSQSKKSYGRLLLGMFKHFFINKAFTYLGLA